MQASLQEVTNFFQSAHWPKEIDRKPTFFSIAGFPHYENVLSNVYQFFFSTESPHGLGSLLIDSIVDVITEKGIRNQLSFNFQKVSVERELSTGNGRLDLLLHNSPIEGQWKEANTIVLIESKVYHWLANDLDDYWKFVKKENPNSQITGIVLGLKHEFIPQKWQENWFSITHLELAKAIEKRLGPLIYRSETRYLTLLLELIENIRNMTDADENFQELLSFFQHNRPAISRAEQIRGQLMQQVPAVIRTTLAPNYSVWTNAASIREGWLIINKSGAQPLKYILGYYQVFHYDELIPNFRIALISEGNSHDIARIWRDKLLILEEAQSSKLQIAEGHYVISKTYELAQSDYRKFPQLIAEKIYNDWQPLEKYWSKNSVNN